MKVLYITTSYGIKNNSAAVRNHSLIKGLQENGVEVEVLTVNWPESMQSSFFLKNESCKVYRTTIPILSKLSSTTKSRNTINNNKYLSNIKEFIKDIIYFPDLCKNWAKIIDENDYLNYDVIISSSDSKSAHYVGRKISKKSSAKWVQIWGDPWHDDVNLNFIQKKRAKTAESKLISIADIVFYTSQPTLDLISEIYPSNKNKLNYLPRSYYKEINSTTNNDKFTVTYLGSLTSGDRDASNFLTAIDSWNTHNKTQIKCDFYGSYPISVKRNLEEYKCVTVFAAIDYGEVISVLSKSDLLLFIANKSGSTQIPGKLYDYLGTNKKILCLVNSKEDSISKAIGSLNRCFIVENTKDSMSLEISHILNNNEKFTPLNDLSPLFIADLFLKKI